MQLDFVTCVPIYCVWGGSYGDGLTMKKNSQVPKYYYSNALYYYFKVPKYQLAKNSIRWVRMEETFSFPLFSRLWGGGAGPPRPAQNQTKPNQTKPIGQQLNVPWVNHPQPI